MKLLRLTLRPLPVALLTALLVLALSVSLAAAHSTTVTRSDPAAGSTVAQSPAQVTAHFSEELDTGGSTMRVVDASGSLVSDGNGKVDLNDPNHQTMIATLPAALADGVYKVQWHAVLTDGDASDGTFTFTIRSISTATPAPGVTSTATDSAARQGVTATPVPTVTLGVTGSAVNNAVPAATVAPEGTPSTLPATGGEQALPWIAAGLAMLALGTGGLAFARSRAR